MWYFVAFMCGVFFGALTMALCAIAKQADLGQEEMLRRMEEK